jgi:CheY-like chemotaxis protein
MAVSSNSKVPAQPRVLLVDDNASGLRARQMVLEELGYDTTGVTCPKQALSLFKKNGYDLVVTDYKMPEMNGIDFIAALRNNVPTLPIILVSGYVEPLGLTEKSTGANVVIMKSAHEVPHLIRAAHRLLNPKSTRKPPMTATASRARRKAVSSS